MWHYHLHVVYVVEKQILWSKRCKDPALVGTVRETIMQVSHSKKWQSRPVLDEFGEPMRTKTGKIVLKKSYSVLQDQYHDAMFAAGYTDVERGERGSTEEHLTTVQFNVMKEQEALDAIIAQQQSAEHAVHLAQANRETIKQDANNVLLFMEAGDYIQLTPEGKVGSQELYEIYTVWCRENGFSPLKNRSFSEFLIANQKKYSIEHSNNLTNLVGRRVWGFTGIEPVLKLPLRTVDSWQRDYLG